MVRTRWIAIALLASLFSGCRSAQKNSTEYTPLYSTECSTGGCADGAVMRKKVAPNTSAPDSKSPEKEASPAKTEQAREAFYRYHAPHHLEVANRPQPKARPYEEVPAPQNTATTSYETSEGSDTGNKYANDPKQALDGWWEKNTDVQAQATEHQTAPGDAPVEQPEAVETPATTSIQTDELDNPFSAMAAEARRQSSQFNKGNNQVQDLAPPEEFIEWAQNAVTSNTAPVANSVNTTTANAAANAEAVTNVSGGTVSATAPAAKAPAAPSTPAVSSESSTTPVEKPEPVRSLASELAEIHSANEPVAGEMPTAPIEAPNIGGAAETVQETLQQSKIEVPETTTAVDAADPFMELAANAEETAVEMFTQESTSGVTPFAETSDAVLSAPTPSQTTSGTDARDVIHTMEENANTLPATTHNVTTPQKPATNLIQTVSAGSIESTGTNQQIRTVRQDDAEFSLDAVPTLEDTYSVDLQTVLRLAGATSETAAAAEERGVEARRRLIGKPVPPLPLNRNNVDTTVTSADTFRALLKRKLGSRFRETDTFTQTQLRAAMAYFDLVSMQARVAMGERNLNDATRLAELTRATSSMQSESDIERVALAVAHRKHELLQARVALDTASTRLGRILRPGSKMGPGVKLVSRDVDLVPIPVMNSHDTLPALINQALLIRGNSDRENSKRSRQLIAGQVRTAFTASQSQLSRMDLTQDKLALAERVFRRDVASIRDSSQRSLEAIQSLESVSRARLDHLAAVVAFNKAELALQYAVGQPVVSP